MLATKYYSIQAAKLQTPCNNALDMPGKICFRVFRGVYIYTLAKNKNSFDGIGLTDFNVGTGYPCNSSLVCCAKKHFAYHKITIHKITIPYHKITIHH